MSRYPQANHTLVTDGDQIRLAGTHRTFVVTTHDAGPYSDPASSLIPEASVIDGRAKPEPQHTLNYGDVIHTTLGAHKIVRTQNPDWPRLVPQFGQRFYVRFEGGNSYSICDRDNDGKGIDWETRSLAAQAVFGPGTKNLPVARTTDRPNVSPCSLAAHNALAGFLSATQPGALA